MNIFPIILMIVFVIVQIGLSKMENKYLGWIMPSFAVFLSLNAAIGYIVYNGKITLDIAGHALLVAAAYNIFTVILIIIYKIVRKKVNNKSK